MRTCKIAPVLSFLAILSVLTAAGQAFALGTPPTPPPPPSTQDPVTGLGGTTSIAAATSIVIDRSYAMASRNGNAFTYFVKGSHQTLGDLVAKLAELLPNTVGGIAFQERSYNKGPSYTAPELTIGNYPSGVDVSYLHYEGGLHGDGFGLRFCPGARATYYAEEQSQTYIDVVKARKLILKFAALVLKNTNPQHDILNDDYTDLLGFIAELLKNEKGNKQGVADDSQFVTQINMFVSFLKDLEGTIIPNELAQLRSTYVKANLGTAFALIAGDTNVSGVTVVNLGGSVSRLFPLPAGKSQTDRGGVGYLVSAQQEFVSLGPTTETSLTRCGISVILQDKVATQEHPDDRWQALIGAEYILRTVLDRSATYDIFARYRPYYRGKSVGYVPLELTAFGGIGPNGYLFGGFRMGFGFSL